MSEVGWWELDKMAKPSALEQQDDNQCNLRVVLIASTIVGTHARVVRLGIVFLCVQSISCHVLALS